MSKSIQLDTNLLDRNYEQMMDALYMKYHYNPNYNENALDPRAKYEMDCALALGEALDPRRKYTDKRIRTYTDREYANGLRRGGDVTVTQTSNTNGVLMLVAFIGFVLVCMGIGAWMML